MDLAPNRRTTELGDRASFARPFARPITGQGVAPEPVARGEPKPCPDR